MAKKIPAVCRIRGKTEAQRRACHNAMRKMGLVKGPLPKRGTGLRGGLPGGMRRFE